MLGFRLALALMTRDAFPFPLAGVVHLRERDRAPPACDRRRVAGHRGGAEQSPHERGHTIDVLTTATVDGTVAWFERSTYLRRSRSTQAKTSSRSEAPVPTATWRVGRDVGRAVPSTSPATATSPHVGSGPGCSGFPRPMPTAWTLARCLAALAGRLPDVYTVDAAFTAGAAALDAGVLGHRGTKGWTFELHDTAGRPILRGNVTPA